MINQNFYELLSIFKSCYQHQSNDNRLESQPIASNQYDFKRFEQLLRFHKLYNFIKIDPLSNGLLEDRYLHALTVMKNIVTMSNESGINEPVFLKGPLLAARLYKNPHLRAFQDIDVLYPISCRKSVATVFSKNYDCASVSSSKEVWIPKDLKQHSLFMLPIEIHYGLPVAVLNPARSFSISGSRYLHLDPKDEIQYLKHHAWIQHRFQHLIWCLDIELYLQKSNILNSPFKNAEKMFSVIRGQNKVNQLSPFERQLVKWVVLGLCEDNPIKISILRPWLMGSCKSYFKYRMTRFFPHIDYQGGIVQ